MQVAVVFPGQGSQTPRSGEPWVDQPSWSVVETIAEATGIDVARLLLEADADELLDTANAQLSTYAISLVVATAIADAGIEPVAAAGHSLGEYSALAAAGMVDVGAGARLVATRGAAMREAAGARPGTMSALLGVDAGTVTELCEDLDEDVWVANDNAPGQVVVAGSAAGIDAVAERAKAHGGRRPMPLRVAGAFHTPYMAPAQAALDAAIAGTAIVAGRAVVWANVDTAAHPTPDEWPGLLSAQLCSPVRWRDEVAAMAASGIDTFVEAGPGTVLTGMIKRIAPEASRSSVATPDDVAELVNHLGRGAA